MNFPQDIAGKVGDRNKFVRCEKLVLLVSTNEHTEGLLRKMIVVKGGSLYST